MKKNFCFLFLFLLNALIFAENPIIQDIQLFPGTNSKINIMWNLPKSPDEEITKVLIYRDTKPIKTAEQLKELEPVYEQIAEFTTYTDTVPDIQNYFYALIAVTKEPYFFILPSINASTVGIHTAVVKVNNPVEPDAVTYEHFYPQGNLRETPLPYIEFTEGINKESNISEEAINAAKILTSTLKPKEQIFLPHYIFEEDLIEPDGSEDYLLFEILRDYFVQRKFPQCAVQLQKLIGTNINEKTRARAYFYLGESLYFQRNYKDAIRTFIKVERDFPSLTSKWIDSSLDFID